MRTSKKVAGLTKVMSNFMSINIRLYIQRHPKMDTLLNGRGFCSPLKLNSNPGELIFEVEKL